MKFKNKEKIIGALVLFMLLIVFLIVGYYTTQPKSLSQKEVEEIFVDVKSNKENKDIVTKTSLEKKEGTSNVKNIIVEIKGAVKKPEVYTLPQGSIVKDLINEAGGLSQDGDISKVNQATKLNDGQCIMIPSKSEGTSNNNFQQSVVINSVQSSSGDSMLVNINTATKEDLEKLPGIGPAMAQRIIDYRDKVGNFNSIEDLKKISGIKDATLDKFKDKITLN